MFNSRSIFIFSLLWVAACTGQKDFPETPQTRLKSYITKTFAVNSAQDRKVLIGFLTGQAKRRLESWSDAQFVQAFVQTKRRFDRLRFREIKPGGKDRVSITYELSYIQEGEKKVRITNKKLCYMSLKDRQWRIDQVKNISQLVEYQNEMSLP